MFFERGTSFVGSLTSVKISNKLKEVFIDYYLFSSIWCFLTSVSQVEISIVAQPKPTLKRFIGFDS